MGAARRRVRWRWPRLCRWPLRRLDLLRGTAPGLLATVRRPPRGAAAAPASPRRGGALPVVAGRSVCCSRRPPLLPTPDGHTRARCGLTLAGGGSGGSGSGSRGREKQHGPHPPPPLWAAYPWPTGGAAAVAAADAKDDAGRAHEAVYWPRSTFAYQLRVPLGGERGADTDRLPERPPPLKSWPRKAAETRLANFNLLVAAASQAADRDFASTRTPPPPPGRVDVRSAHKPRAPRA